jgi:hypothetical protein
MPLTFDFYGLTIAVNSASADLVEEVRRYFAFFVASPGDAKVQLELRLTAPPYAELLALAAAFFTPRNVCFKHDQISYLDYFGEGWRFTTANGNNAWFMEPITICCTKSRRSLYSIHSRSISDSHLHRLHSLGVTYRDRGVLLLLPPAVASTMALELMRQPGLPLSEDTLDRPAWSDLAVSAASGCAPRAASRHPQGVSSHGESYGV